MQCCRPRQAQQNKRDSHRRESRETSYKNRKRAPGQRNVPSTNNKKKNTTTICDQHRLCKTKNKKRSADGKNIGR